MLRKLLNRLRSKQMIVVRIHRDLCWTNQDAQEARLLMGSELWKKLMVFQHDAILGEIIKRGSVDAEFVKGWRYGLAALNSFKGHDEATRNALFEDEGLPPSDVSALPDFED